MGNLAATPTAAAAFLFHWLVADEAAGGDVLLPAARVAEMKTMQAMTTGYYPGTATVFPFSAHPHLTRCHPRNQPSSLHPPLCCACAAAGEFYGLGLQRNDFYANANVSANLTRFLGHGGEDYGSQAKLNHCNEELGVCLNIATNSRVGLNCSHPDMPGLNPHLHALDATEETGCLVWQAILDVATNGTAVLDCGVGAAWRTGGAEREDALHTTYVCAA
jgi:hypothetical protein